MYRIISGLLIIFIILTACSNVEQNYSDFTAENYYSKEEYRIPMRDGKTLFTAVYTPKDSSRSYPILLNRTPYRCAPYGPFNYKYKLGPSDDMMLEGYIFVYQDVRGKYMSEGEYVNVRPHIPDKKSKTEIDESTDTYDTIDWLIKNVKNNNGRAGMWGISYPGFYAAMGLIDAHPALKAVSPQAPIADWFINDDMHHNGAFSLNLTFNFFSTFGVQREGRQKYKVRSFDHGTDDGYKFFLEMGPLPEANKKYLKSKIPFWNEIMEHGTYDSFWQSRNILPHLNNIKPAVMTVGGWFDAEDLYGPLNIYQTIEENNPGSFNILVMGPWAHGYWARTAGDQLGDFHFGAKTSIYYQEELELPFFNYFLKDKGAANLPEARCFDTGINKWKSFEQWPAEELDDFSIYLQKNGRLSFNSPSNEHKDVHDEYISDPAKPVPYINKITTAWEKTYMTADQRFAASRPDVLVYQSDILDGPVTIAGPLTASLFVSTSGTDADWVVKLIDVYPDDAQLELQDDCGVKMGGYQRMVRGDIMRAKFRNSFTIPEPMTPDKITPLSFKLQDIFHTFKKGHRIMVQIQSSWFPLFDRNPQKFTDIYSAAESDFQKALNRVYFSERYPSQLKCRILEN